MRHGQETNLSFPFPRRFGLGETMQTSMGRRRWLAEVAGTLLLLGWLAGRWPGNVFWGGGGGQFGESRWGGVAPWEDVGWISSGALGESPESD